MKILLLLLTMFSLSCGNKKDKESSFKMEPLTDSQINSTKILKAKIDSIIKVDLNPFAEKQSFDFGSVVKEVKLIPLETKDESLVDVIQNIIITEQYIYIHDRFKGGGLIIFDNNGKFVKRIPNGKGPGEIVKMNYMDFDRNKKEIVLSQYPYLYFYTQSGEFLRYKKLPFAFYNFKVIKDGYIFSKLNGQSDPILQSLSGYTKFVTDKNFKLKSVGLYNSFDDILLEGYDYLYNNDNVYFTDRFNDTIYRYITTTGKLEAKYIMDYSKKKLPKHYLSGTNNSFEDGVKNNDYYFFLGKYFDTNTHHVFFPRTRRNGSIVYRDKQSGNLIGGTTATYNTEEIPPIAFPEFVSDNYFISLYYPNENSFLFSNSSIISEKDKQKVKDLTEYDNPVLTLFKLKEF